MPNNTNQSRSGNGFASVDYVTEFQQALINERFEDAYDLMRLMASMFKRRGEPAGEFDHCMRSIVGQGLLYIPDAEERQPLYRRFMVYIRQRASERKIIIAAR